MDRLYKINLYLLRKYKDDLIKEFNIEIPEGVFNDPWFKLLETTFNQKVDKEDETLIMSLITSKIEEEMKKEMPDPWYCYGFGGKVSDGNTQPPRRYKGCASRSRCNIYGTQRC